MPRADLQCWQRPKPQTFYVILAGRQRRTGPRWLTREGTSTTMRSKAARFVTVEEAQAFAAAHAVSIDGVKRSIDLEAFTAFELSVGPG